LLVVSVAATQPPRTGASDLATLRADILAAKDITAATIPALDILNHPDHRQAGALVLELLRMKGEKRDMPALALLRAMQARKLAWTDVVPGVLAILGDGSPELVEAAESLVRELWLDPKSVEGQACLRRAGRVLREPERDAVQEIRGAVHLAQILKRVEDVEPLITLLRLDLQRETKMRVAAALEAITLDQRFGTDPRAWHAWAEKTLRPGMSREDLLEANWSAVVDYNSEFMVRELKRTVTALGEKEIEPLGHYLVAPYPKVAVAAARLVGELYVAITDETLRKNVQAKVLPMVLRLLDHHREEVVVAAVSEVGKLSKPSLTGEPICAEVRSKLLELIESGTPAVRRLAVTALIGFADPEATDAVPDRLEYLLEHSRTQPADYRVALVNTLGAFQSPGSVGLFKRLTERDPDEAVRIAAATMFLEVAPAEAIQTLSEILGRRDTSSTLRRRIVSELGNVITKHPAVIRPLVQRLSEETDPNVLIICAGSLGYAQGKPHVQQAGIALHERLKASPGGGDPKLAAVVATSLGKLGYAPAVSDLIPLTRLGNRELKEQAEAALIRIAIHDVKKTLDICALLLAERMYGPVIQAYTQLSRDPQKAKALNEQTKENRFALTMYYVHALMATEDPKNLEVALKEVETLRRTKPTDPDLMLLQARILHLWGPDKAAETIAFLTSNRPPNGKKAIHRKWNIMGAWASLRRGKKEAASLFKGIGNGETDPMDPVHWEYLVGYALALVKQDVDANRELIESLLAKLPADGFARRAPAWLQAHVAEIRAALAAPPAKKPAEKPAENPDEAKPKAEGSGEKNPAKTPPKKAPAKVVKPG